MPFFIIFLNNNIYHLLNYNIYLFEILKVGIGDWGLGIGDWGLGIGPNPQSPIPNPQSPFIIPKKEFIKFNKYYYLKK